MGSEIERKVINSFLEKNNLAFAWFPVKSENTFDLKCLTYLG